MFLTGADIAAFLGAGDDEHLAEQAESALDVIYPLVWSYTRGCGFNEYGEPNGAIRAVIVVAAARLVANPEQIPTSVGSVQTSAGFNGWTLAEQFVLNRYRKRAQ